jgi:hypothetical protein
MLQDRKAVALVVNFAEQAFQLQGLTSLIKDPTRYPEFSPELVQSMRQETRLFLASIIQEDRSLLDILDAQDTYVDARLAELYGLEPPVEAGFQRVRLDNTPRGGILTQASLLALTSRPTRNAPVLRGKWILDNVLHDPPPPPAPGVPSLEEQAHQAEAESLRQQMDRHRADPQCAACHARMDPLGFALEAFDPIGRLRNRDEAGNPVDTSAEFPDGSHVDGVVELRRLLRERYAQAFLRGFAEKMFVYAVGREVTDQDECALLAIVRETRKQGDRFSALVEQVVLCDAFRSTRLAEE